MKPNRSYKAPIKFVVCILFFILQILVVLVPGCASVHTADAPPSEKLLTIVIPDHTLNGSPKQIVTQLNKLTKKYDLPTHEGVAIRFDPAVDSQCCTLGIFRGGEPLTNWLKDVCEACGSKCRFDDAGVIIELLPLSEKQTADLEAHLTNGLAELCKQFRSKRGQERYALGEELFQLLPHSPVTWEKGTLVSYDYEHPNYILYKKDIISLLGKPDRNVNNEHFYYSLRPRGAIIWELGVEFDEHEYMTNPSLAGGVSKND